MSLYYVKKQLFLRDYTQTSDFGSLTKGRVSSLVPSVLFCVCVHARACAHMHACMSAAVSEPRHTRTTAPVHHGTRVEGRGPEVLFEELFSHCPPCWHRSLLFLLLACVPQASWPVAFEPFACLFLHPISSTESWNYRCRPAPAAFYMASRD